jgi:ubiquinone/menaquinone biosynthesis C-methylase UbiE
MKGRVLDVGGTKDKRRGNFRPPTADVTSWEYLNHDESTSPNYCAGAESIPLPDNSVDTVIMTEVFEYLRDPENVLSEIHRITKKGGYLLISTPFLNPIHGDYGYDRGRYTAINLREMAERTQWSVYSIEPMGSVGAVVYDILRVAFGYASPHKGGREKLNKMLRKTTPFFWWLERKMSYQKRYITTGYFLVLRQGIDIGN